MQWEEMCIPKIHPLTNKYEEAQFLREQISEPKYFSGYCLSVLQTWYVSLGSCQKKHELFIWHEERRRHLQAVLPWNYLVANFGEKAFEFLGKFQASRQRIRSIAYIFVNRAFKTKEWNRQVKPFDTPVILLNFLFARKAL